MTPSQFIGQNIHFAVLLFAALACFAAGWLHFDAWKERRRLPGLTKWVGFYLLAIAFLMSSVSWGEGSVMAMAATIMKLIGYGAIIADEIIEPLQPKPDTSAYLSGGISFTSAVPVIPGVLLPLAAFTAGALYWRRATTGLERHLKPLGYTFLIFALSDALNLARLWRDTDNPLLQPFVASVGHFWIIEHLALFAASAWLTWWVWRYLTKRLLTQLFLTAASLTVAIVLITTTSITTLLYSNLQRDALNNLQTAGQILRYAIESKAAETRANAEILAQDEAASSAVAANDNKLLTTYATDLLVTKKLSEVIVTGNDGQVLARASDPDRYGDSLSSNPLIQRAIAGTISSSTVSQSGVLAPTLMITTASPMRHQGAIVGVTLTSLALDNSFVDGIKNTTGLDSAVYSAAIRAATTLTAPDGNTRSIGAKETRAEIINTTLRDGKPWTGNHTIASEAFLAAYLPIKDVEGASVGMLFVGEPRAAVLQTADQVIRLTFAGAAAWLLLLMIPLYIVARRIVGQVQ